MLEDQKEAGTIMPLKKNESLLVNTNDIIFNPVVMAQFNTLANIMATGKSTVPNHLKGSSGDCFAIVMQAAQWGMNPFAVAQKTHIINGVLGYEAQLVNAVINSMAPTKDRLHFEWFGDWTRVVGKFVEKTNGEGKKYKAPDWKSTDEEGLGVRAWATLKGENEPRALELLLTQAQVRNSTLWASDPKQQLAYLAIKRWARLYCPDVILGVYTPDELQEPIEKEINPMPEQRSPEPRPTPQKPIYSDESFQKNKASWREMVISGKKSPDAIIKSVETKAVLTEEQRFEIDSWSREND